MSCTRKAPASCLCILSKRHHTAMICLPSALHEISRRVLSIVHIQYIVESRLGCIALTAQWALLHRAICVSMAVLHTTVERLHRCVLYLLIVLRLHCNMHTFVSTTCELLGSRGEVAGVNGRWTMPKTAHGGDTVLLGSKNLQDTRQRVAVPHTSQNTLTKACKAACCTGHWQVYSNAYSSTSC